MSNSKIKAWYVSGGAHLAEGDFMILSSADVRAYLEHASIKARKLEGSHAVPEDAPAVVVAPAPGIVADRYYPKVFAADGRRTRWVVKLFGTYRVLPRKAR